MLTKFDVCALADPVSPPQGDEQQEAVPAVQDSAPHLWRPPQPCCGEGPHCAFLPHRGAEDYQEGGWRASTLRLWAICGSTLDIVLESW